MKSLKIIFNWIFGKGAMALENYRDEKGNLKAEEISEGYVLLDYSGNPLCICVCAGGVWVTITPYNQSLDKELATLLKGKYTTRHLKWLVEIQDKFEADLLTREELLKNSKTNRI